jgi:hypothetical protein
MSAHEVIDRLDHLRIDPHNLIVIEHNRMALMYTNPSDALRDFMILDDAVCVDEGNDSLILAWPSVLRRAHLIDQAYVITEVRFLYSTDADRFMYERDNHCDTLKS